MAQTPYIKESDPLKESDEKNEEVKEVKKVEDKKDEESDQELNDYLHPDLHRAGILKLNRKYDEALKILNSLSHDLKDLDTETKYLFYSMRSGVYYETKRYKKALQDCNTILANNWAKRYKKYPKYRFLKQEWVEFRINIYGPLAMYSNMRKDLKYLIGHKKYCQAYPDRVSDNIRRYYRLIPLADGIKYKFVRPCIIL